MSEPTLLREFRAVNADDLNDNMPLYFWSDGVVTCKKERLLAPSVEPVEDEYVETIYDYIANASTHGEHNKEMSAEQFRCELLEWLDAFISPVSIPVEEPSEDEWGMEDRDDALSFLPPVARHIPSKAMLDTATDGAGKLDWRAFTRYGRNFIGHAVAELVTAGWLKSEPADETKLADVRQFALEQSKGLADGPGLYAMNRVLAYIDQKSAAVEEEIVTVGYVPVEEEEGQYEPPKEEPLIEKINTCLEGWFPDGGYAWEIASTIDTKIREHFDSKRPELEWTGLDSEELDQLAAILFNEGKS